MYVLSTSLWSFTWENVCFFGYGVLLVLSLCIRLNPETQRVLLHYAKSVCNFHLS